MAKTEGMDSSALFWSTFSFGSYQNLLRVFTDDHSSVTNYNTADIIAAMAEITEQFYCDCSVPSCFYLCSAHQAINSAKAQILVITWLQYCLSI